MQSLLAFSLIFAIVFSPLVLCEDPAYDHQKTTYTAQFEPKVVTNVDMSITTFFSPDHSIDTETKLIESATTSIDVGTPGWDSWSGCTNFTGSSGCSVAYLRSNEAFPIFQALLNAIHRGVTVRILTNNYNTPITPGMIDPIDFLTLAGAKTRYYTTTTFMHAKYISVDSSKAMIASVNFDYTSFMENREAGVIVEGNSDLINFMTNVFNFDFNQGGKWPTNSYNASDMAIINDKSSIPVNIPAPRNFSGSYVTSVNTVSGNYDKVQVVTSPDFAFTAVTQSLNATSTSLNVYIYQITGGFCDMVNHLHSSGVTLKILVSDRIFSYTDYKAAKACYTSLYNSGYTVRMTAEHMYTYSHQKFWIIDGKTVWLSSGNWGETDYPTSPNRFPPHSESGWRDVNRDFTIEMTNSGIVAVYENVLDQDYKRGHDFDPYSKNSLTFVGAEGLDWDY